MGKTINQAYEERNFIANIRNSSSHLTYWINDSIPQNLNVLGLLEFCRSYSSRIMVTTPAVVELFKITGKYISLLDQCDFGICKTGLIEEWEVFSDYLMPQNQILLVGEFVDYIVKIESIPANFGTNNFVTSPATYTVPTTDLFDFNAVFRHLK